MYFWLMWMKDNNSQNALVLDTDGSWRRDALMPWSLECQLTALVWSGGKVRSWDSGMVHSQIRQKNTAPVTCRGSSFHRSAMTNNPDRNTSLHHIDFL